MMAANFATRLIAKGNRTHRGLPALVPLLLPACRSTLLDRPPLGLVRYYSLLPNPGSLTPLFLR